MRKIKFLFLNLLIVTAIFMSVSSVSAIKVTSNNKPLQQVDLGLNYQLEEYCVYQREDKNAKDYDLKILFIYKSGSEIGPAEIIWPGAGCSNGFNYNGGSWCRSGADGKQGIKNWGKNSSGVQSGLDPDFDAAEYYKKNKTCPPFLSQAQVGSKNYFYLSPSDYSSGYTKIQNAAKKDGGNNYNYYNILSGQDNLNANLVCAYYHEEPDENSQTFDFAVGFTTDGKVEVKTNKFLVGDTIVEGVEANSRIISSSYLKYIKNNKCPKTLTGCYVENFLQWGKNVQPFNIDDLFGLYDNTINSYYNFKIFGDPSLSKNFCDESKVGTFYCVGDNCSDDNICQAYDDYKLEIEDILKDYKNKSGTDKKNTMNVYNKKKDEVSEYCKSILKTLNYAEGGCVSSCINLSKELADMEIKYGIRSAYKETKCNIGPSILNLVYNVLKWLKYIAPVLVIILSILDFIKALASQKDDDMKKAQEKFVKRLIVAVILFLLPLIINFMLSTFGLYNSECDITNLF